MLSAFFIALTSFAVPALGEIYSFYNACPSSINIYLAGRPLRMSLATYAEFSVDTLSEDEGYFYTDANSKSESSNGTRVAFRRLDQPNGYFYMVVDPNNVNVGMMVTTRTSGVLPCNEATCFSATCNVAYNNNQEPTDSYLDSLPTSGVLPFPLWSCYAPASSATITFCPDGKWPPTSLALHPDGNTEYCLDVQGAKFENGTPVQLYECNGTPAQQWVLSRSSTKVKLAGTNFCLDAGSNPGNGVGMKIWECYDDLPAQSWYYTDDNRLALEGQGLCLDLANGAKGNGAFVQTWQCTDYNTNQVWSDPRDIFFL